MSARRPQIVEAQLDGYVRVDCASGASQDWAGLSRDASCTHVCMQISGCREWVSSMAILTEACLLSSAFMRRCYFQLQHLSRHVGSITTQVLNQWGVRTTDRMIADFRPGLNFTFLGALDSMRVWLGEKEGCPANYVPNSSITSSCYGVEDISINTEKSIFVTRDVRYTGQETRTILRTWGVADSEPITLGVCANEFALIEPNTIHDLNRCFTLELA
eukprot:Gregarina_sp_Pseudo_9__797@NODE_1509_length_1537_cov_3_436582_g1398_i0_p1_GENE_NODE_1509_length_1537_cov_3_436582_g1398_i0NODE_1509_length_1537_cov_3_436582_g1398_i0_p1_ORF_typecomplete_len217_score27_94_NODE_1509_length_1537_cov_3_436582_g1398_i063713